LILTEIQIVVQRWLKVLAFRAVAMYREYLQIARIVNGLVGEVGGWWWVVGNWVEWKLGR